MAADMQAALEKLEAGFIDQGCLGTCPEDDCRVEYRCSERSGSGRENPVTSGQALTVKKRRLQTEGSGRRWRMSRSLLRGRLKTTALVSLRVLNSPATLRNWGGWFYFENPTNTETMGLLIFSAIFAISFAWMWNRNDKARKRLKRVTLAEGQDEAAFQEWRDHTRKRMGRADVAALLLTAMPLAAFVPVAIHLCAWPALILAFRSNGSGRKADALAKQLGIKRGVGWLASKKIPPPVG